MNKNIKIIISATLVVIWMAVIFVFSATPADESDKQSKGVIYIITEKIEGKSAEQIENIDSLNHLIRKFAHGSVYFVLCMLIMNLILQIKDKNYKFTYALVAILISFLYACTDEFHQIFVDGRAGRFTDILIDTLGATLGVTLYVLIFKIRKNMLINKK